MPYVDLLALAVSLAALGISLAHAAPALRERRLARLVPLAAAHAEQLGEKGHRKMVVAISAARRLGVTQAEADDAALRVRLEAHVHATYKAAPR